VEAERRWGDDSSLVSRWTTAELTILDPCYIVQQHYFGSLRLDFMPNKVAAHPLAPGFPHAPRWQEYTNGDNTLMARKPTPGCIYCTSSKCQLSFLGIIDY
jgi:hypothetical protein